MGAGILLVTRTSTQPTMTSLLGEADLNEIQMIRFETAFSRAGLRGAQRQGNRIVVPTETRNDYLVALEDAGVLPFVQPAHETEPLTQNLLVSQEERNRQRQQQKADQLGRKITSFADVAWASVEYDELQLGGFQPRLIRAASIIVVPSNNTPLPADRISMIQDLVRGAYAGMTDEEVTVTDTAAHRAYTGRENPILSKIKQAEADLERRLSKLLDAFPGIRVAVTAKPPVQNSAQPAESEHQLARMEMRVSIGVPDSQLRMQWEQQHPEAEERPSSDQLLGVRESTFVNIRDAVVPFIGDSSAPESIQIWSYPDLVAGNNAPVRERGTESTAFSWLSLSRRISSIKSFATEHVLFLVPVGGLVLLTLVVSIAALKMRGRTSQPDQLAATSDEDIGDESSKQGRDQRHLKEDLTELVDQNPELAAQIVHRWVSDAA